MRDLDLPATGYWFDDGYFTAVGSFDWDPAKFPAPEALIAEAHALGFAAALWHSPYLDAKAAATAALQAKAKASGFFPPVAGIPLNHWGTLIDLTNPSARAFWQENLSAYTNMGVDGFKLDYGEDVVPGLTAGRNVWEFCGRERRAHHARALPALLPRRLRRDAARGRALPPLQARDVRRSDQRARDVARRSRLDLRPERGSGDGRDEPATSRWAACRRR